MKKEKVIRLLAYILEERMKLSAQMNCLPWGNPRYGELFERASILSTRWWRIYKKHLID